MIGRKTVLGLSLLSALALCAFMAQGASAAWETAKHTTIFTCVEGGTKDFKDAHCKESVTAGTGKFGHVEIAAGKPTKVTVSNETTAGAREPAVLTGSLFGATVKVTCQKVANGAAENVLENKQTETEGKITHDVVGKSSVVFTECKVEGNGATCKVKEPVKTDTNVAAQEEPTTGNMAFNFTPLVEGTAYATLEFEGGCLITKTEVKGSARGTPEGATINFKAEDESLTAFGGAATFTGKFTVKMAEEVGVPENPISVTTVTDRKSVV